MTYWSRHVGIAWRQFTKITFDVIYSLIFHTFAWHPLQEADRKGVCWKTDMNANLKTISDASFVDRWYEWLTKMKSRWNSAQNPLRTDDGRTTRFVIRVLPQLIWSTKETQHLPLGQMSVFIDIDEISDSVELKIMLSAQYTFILNIHVVNKVQLLSSLIWCSV